MSSSKVCFLFNKGMFVLHSTGLFQLFQAASQIAPNPQEQHGHTQFLTCVCPQFPLPSQATEGHREPPKPRQTKVSTCMLHTSQLQLLLDSQKCRPHQAPQKGKGAPSLQSAKGQFLWRPGCPKSSGPTALTGSDVQDIVRHRERTGSDFGWGVWGLQRQQVRTTMPTATSILSVPHMRWAQLISWLPSTRWTLVEPALGAWSSPLQTGEAPPFHARDLTWPQTRW